MNDYTKDEWRLLDWIDKQIHNAAIGKKSFLEKQYFEADHLKYHHQVLTTSDILCIQILEHVNEYGIPSMIKAFNIIIPTDNEFLLNLLFELPIEYIILLVENSENKKAF